MAELPKDEFFLESLKYKIKLIFQGAGIKIFSTLLVILGFIIVATIISIGYFYRSIWGLLVVGLVLVGAYYLIKYILISVNSLAKSRKTQSLFFTPKEWLAIAKFEANLKFGTNKSGLNQIQESTMTGQPQFRASNERSAEVTGILMEEK